MFVKLHRGHIVAKVGSSTEGEWINQSDAWVNTHLIESLVDGEKYGIRYTTVNMSVVTGRVPDQTYYVVKDSVERILFVMNHGLS